jgi:alkyl hydroperoxide reductase subunit D
MPSLAQIGDAFPDAARDVRLNLAAVLAESSLDPRLRYAVALASATACPDAERVAAGVADGEGHLDEAARDDARAAAALMAMNNVFYRFRHMVGSAAYAEMPARLRMTRLAKPRTSKAEFELLSLAVSAIEGCEACVRAHERAVIDAGLSPENVLDAVRIASVVRAAATASWMARHASGAQDVRPTEPTNPATR